MNKIKKFLKENVMIISSISAVIAILGFTGFKIDIPTYYSALTIESKVIFLFFINMILTLLLFAISISRKK